MANDPNNSGNGRPPNSLSELGAQKMPSSINRILENVSPSETQRYQWLIEQQAKIEGDKTYALGMQNPMLLTNPQAAKQFNSLKNRHASYIRQQEIMEEAATNRANRMVSTAVNQSFSTSTINGQISQRLESTGAQQESLRIAANVEPETLQRRIRISEGRMARYGAEASQIQTVNKFGEPDKSAQERLQQLYGLRELEMNRQTGMQGAARIHRQQGLDPESRMDSLVRSAGQASDVLGRQSPEIQKLLGMSSGDFRKHETEAAERLSKAFDALSTSTLGAGKELDALKAEAAGAEKEFKDVQKARGEGGGGDDRGINKWQMAQSGFQAGAAAMQAIGVNQRLGMEQNQTGYAQWENQKYATYKSAMSGDVASAMLLGRFDESMDFGKELGVNAQSAALLQMGGGAMQGAAGFAEVGSVANAVSTVLNTSTAAQTAKQGVMDMAGGAAVFATAGTDAFRGVSEHQATLAGASARLEKIKAVQAIGAEQMQGFRDFGVGLSGAAMGMGSAGNAFLESTATAAQLSKLSAARISPAQFAEMAQQGVNSMGSGFDKEQIIGARALERRGLGSMSQNMERMSQLYAAGANNPQEGLGRILEAAIPKGFDNSKLVGQLVQSSAAMAQAAGGAATGLNMTGAAASLLTSGIGPNTANREAMLQHAADVSGGFKGAETNISTSYRGMLNVARMQGSLGKGGIDAVIAGNTNIEQLMSIRDLGGNVGDRARRQALITAGFDPNTSGAALQKVIRAKQMADLDFGATTGASGRNSAALLERMEKAGSYNNLGESDQQALSRSAKLGSGPGGPFAEGTTGEDLFKRTMGMNTKTPGGTGKGVFSDDAVGKMQKDMDNLRTQGFVQLAKSAGAAATALDGIAGAGKGFSKVIELFDKIEKQSDSIEKGGKDVAGKAAKRGEQSTDVKVVVEALGAAGTKLNAVLDGIARKFNIQMPGSKGGGIHQ
jgi:hypothetical protein